MKFWQNTDVEEAEVSVHMDIKNLLNGIIDCFDLLKKKILYVA